MTFLSTAPKRNLCEINAENAVITRRFHCHSGLLTYFRQPCQQKPPCIYLRQVQKLNAKGADNMAEYPYPDKKSDDFAQQDYLKSGSSTDCTGLIPSAPHSDDEYNSYQDVYSFLPPPPDEDATI